MIYLGREALERYVDSHPVLRVAEAAVAAGMSFPSVYAFIIEKGMERVCRGVYAPPDAWLDEMFLVSLRSQMIVFSHESALLLHGLTDREPKAPTVTVPSHYNAGHLTGTGVRVFYIKPELIGLGRTTRQTPEGNPVPCYDLERTVCDCIRMYSLTLTDRRPGISRVYEGIRSETR